MRLETCMPRQRYISLPAESESESDWALGLSRASSRSNCSTAWADEVSHDSEEYKAAATAATGPGGPAHSDSGLGGLGLRHYDRWLGSKSQSRVRHLSRGQVTSRSGCTLTVAQVLDWHRDRDHESALRVSLKKRVTAAGSESSNSCSIQP